MMKRKKIAPVVMALAFVIVYPVTFQGQQTAGIPVAQIVAQSEQALEQHDTAKALRLIQEGLTRFSNEEALHLQLARVYVYQGHDGQALDLIKTILAKNPASREAKLELAQVYGYRRDYLQSDRLYHELLAKDPADEAASLGLIHNLILEGKRPEAREETRRAITLHPTSLGLQQFSDYLSQSLPATEAQRPRNNRIQATESFFADTSGNRSFYSSQGFVYQVGKNASTRFRIEETSLWASGTATETVLSALEETRLKLTRYIGVRASAGLVRFPDSSSHPLYGGDLELYPFKALLVSGGFSRVPVFPTFDAAQFDLLTEGWHGRVDYRTKNLSVAGTFALTHLSDGNRAEREWVEGLRWFPVKEQPFSIAAGYAFRHLHFAQDLNHGYFSPLQYHSHLVAAGVRFRIGKHYRGEYLGYGGAEVRTGVSGHSPAGELLLKNDFFFGRWDLTADYSYFHLTQATGAFRANAVTTTFGYRF